MTDTKEIKCTVMTIIDDLGSKGTVSGEFCVELLSGNINLGIIRLNKHATHSAENSNI